MARILLLNPNRWGRGITAIWIPSHAAVLKSRGHEVELFDCTFYTDWRWNEVAYNTENRQYRPSDYERHITLKTNGVLNDLEACIARFKPDLIFWSAISSHIHGEGEYVNVQYGHELIRSIQIPESVIRIAGGLQPTADPASMFARFPNVDFFIRGESELVLAEIAGRLRDRAAIRSIRGLVYRHGDRVVVNPPQDLISDMSCIPPYDYSVFEDQTFFRAYRGNVVRAVDYEMSRGCIYTCSYCVETVIQRYYGFTERTSQGTLKRASGYVRTKSADRIIVEMKTLSEKYGIRLFRCQDTNFLTMDRDVLHELAERMDRDPLDVDLYIETRPDGINESNIRLLKRLKVHGIGMGVELASEDFRESNLHRYSSREKIVQAFRLLREAGIERTAYNIIGLPEEDEEQILDTIRFNRLIDPDSMTVAFYSPYLGTEQQIKGAEIQDFDAYEYDVDAQLRTVSKSTRVHKELLEFYKTNFVRLAREGLDRIDELKAAAGDRRN